VTYSIVGRDAETGDLGCAVQSQSFNAGAPVAWARAGVGAIATQSFTDRRYGYRGLELLAAGREPQSALDELVAADELPGLRQVAFLDATGRSAQWTGGNCIRCAGHVAGENWAAQGNMLAAECWFAMGEAFESTTGSLAQRLMRALEAAEEAGGDFRGRGGAGIVVVPATGEPWERIVDLRVEDGDDSLVELRRVLERAEAYHDIYEAHPRAPVARERGLSDTEVLWFELLDAASDGDIDHGRRLLTRLEAVHPHYRDTARTMALHPFMPSALTDIVGD
jgi:uncharacterized Ntn-hydrolase superfamily protein